MHQLFFFIQTEQWVPNIHTILIILHTLNATKISIYVNFMTYLMNIMLLVHSYRHITISYSFFITPWVAVNTIGIPTELINLHKLYEKAHGVLLIPYVKTYANYLIKHPYTFTFEKKDPLPKHLVKKKLRKGFKPCLKKWQMPLKIWLIWSLRLALFTNPRFWHLSNE